MVACATRVPLPDLSDPRCPAWTAWCRPWCNADVLTAHEREESTGSVLYSTTPLFLEKLGLGSLDELPDIAPLLPEPTNLKT